MKLKCSFEILKIDDELMAVPIGDDGNFHGVLRVNDSACAIIGLLGEETSIENMLFELRKQFDATDEDLLNSINDLLSVFRAEGLLSE